MSKHPKLTARRKRELKRRLMNFETFNGAFIFIPWGLGFLYCGLYELKMGYSYALLSVGATLVIWGLRKATVDRVKQRIKQERMVAEYLRDLGVR